MMVIAASVGAIVSASAQDERSPWEQRDPDKSRKTAQNQAQTDSLEAGSNAGLTVRKKRDEFSTYPALTQWLEDVYGRIDEKNMSSGAHDLYARARARIEAARQRCDEEDKPSQECRSLFSACSLYTVSAVTRLEIVQTKRATDSVNAQYRRITRQLHEVYERIDSIEKGNTARLKEKLESQKARTEALKKKAQQKFEKLQSKLVSVTQDARGTIISMADILFEFGSARLKDKLKITLARVAGILNIFREYNVIIEGHTDNVGSLSYNQKLSRKRATNVRDFLIEQGIDSTRLRAVGYGPSRPIADNSTPGGRQKNRRVDLVVHRSDTGDVDDLDE